MKNRLYFTVLVLFVLTGTFSNTAHAQQVSDWKGFEQVSFTFEEYNAWVVKPQNPQKGNPWIWRARFPGWHTEMDSMLASEGFHLAFIDTKNKYGSTDAVAVWDRFYAHVIKNFNLNKKVTLEGVSRGGLFIYNWAKKNPEKVNAIYAEAPVCDFKSWPAGFGEGKGSQDDWKLLMAEYGFVTVEEAKDYVGNPIDGLAELAKHKVPVIHMIGLNDEVVPAKENTLMLIDRYIKLGGIATIVPCTKGEQKLFGHHFPIDNPRLGADFIKYHSQLPKAKLDASAYHIMRGGIRNSFIKFEQEKKGRVAFLGGSITKMGGWRDSICNYLASRFPDTEFDFIPAGIGSMGTTPAAFRLQRDVLKNGPVDLLFEEAAVNDATNGRTAEEQIRAMEGIVRHVRKNNPVCDVVIMHFVDPDKMKTYRKGEVPEVIQNHEKVAEHYNISTINLAKEVTERIDAGEFTWTDDFKNLHPSPFGQNIYYQSMKIFLDNAWFGFVADDDKPEVHKMPDKLDVACYNNGILVPVEDVGRLKGWSYVENWQPDDKKGTRSNYANVPMLVGEDAGKIVKFKFEGNAVGIAVAAGPDAGIIEYSIDGELWQKQDLFTRWSSYLHLPWYYTLASGLKPGKHILQLRVSKEKNQASAGRFCRIRYFFVNENKKHQ
ncbi:MAG: GDSL-type esterase/lipase family protein [Bacteroidota bacterium]